MDDEPARLRRMIDQLMAQSVAQGAMIRTLVGVIADGSPDWRDTIAEFRMMVEWSLRHIEWVGSSESEADAIRAEALNHLHDGLDDLHDTMLQGEKETASD